MHLSIYLPFRSLEVIVVKFDYPVAGSVPPLDHFHLVGHPVRISVGQVEVTVPMVLA